MAPKMNGTAAKVLMVLAGVLCLAAASGCDMLGLSPYVGTGYWGNDYPDWGLYDPYNDIQSVIDYRQDVMDWSANAWDEYIRE